MSSMLERAAREVLATMKVATGVEATAENAARELAREALLAALDPEDEALVQTVAEAIASGKHLSVTRSVAIRALIYLAQ